jgi:hypothetical protein
MAKRKQDDEFAYDIIAPVGIYAPRTTETGFQGEVNIVSFNGNPAKLDLRGWAPGHERMGKGITLTEEQAVELTKILVERYAHVLAAPAAQPAANATTTAA